MDFKTLTAQTGRWLWHIAVGAVLVAPGVSCQRDHLYYETLTRDNVQLDIDWSQTAFAASHKDYTTTSRLNGVTIWAFDSATHRLKTELPPDADPLQPRLWLEPGTYDLIVMNDSRCPALCFTQTDCSKTAKPR